MLITFYNYNLDSITSIFPKSSYSQFYQQWGWNNFCVISENKCDRYSERGKLLETINGSSFSYPTGSDIILDDYTFVILLDILNDFGGNALSVNNKTKLVLSQIWCNFFSG